MKEVNDLLKRLGELEDAPLIWINKKVYDMAQEIKRLKEEYMILQNASDEVEEEKDKEIERLQDLCNKYEEEHKTAFEEWKKAINIINELEKYLQENINNIYAYFDNTPFGVEETYKEVLSKLQELKGVDKE